MADYRDPKVTTTDTRTRRGAGTWIGAVIVALIIIALIWWWWGGNTANEAGVAPATGTATEQPATGGTGTTGDTGTTGGTTTVPAQPAQPAQQ